MSMNLEKYHQIVRVQSQIKNFPEQVAFREWQNESVETALTWREAGDKIERIAKALLQAGVKIQDSISIFGNNSINWALVDLAILHIRAVTVPIYATNTEKQSAYIMNNAEAKILFVDGQTQFDVALQMCELVPQLQSIVVLDPSVDLKGCSIAYHLEQFDQLDTEAQHDEWLMRLNNTSLDDLFTIIYTSGTTGEPKGVMLDYRNMAAQCVLHDNRLKVDNRDVSLSFLPLSHIFERAWSFYVMHTGAQNVYLHDTNYVRNALSTVRPTLMCAVPRFYEKIYSAVHDKVQKSSLLKRGIFKLAIRLGKRNFFAQQKGKNLNPISRGLYNLADKAILSKIRGLLGGRVRFLPAAGAKLDDHVILFFKALGVNIKYGYGMTETCATVSCWEEGQEKLGSIGQPLEGIEVRIGQDNEIQVRGPTVMKGYYKRPEETEATFTSDGWLKTGDAGKIDDNGNLYITERIKDLMKTSNGKYIAPQLIEGTLGRDRFIEQIAVIADARKFVSALIVPCFDALEEYAKSVNLKYKDRLELLKNSHIVELFEKRVTAIQKELAMFERVKKFRLLPKMFSMELGELTPTLKLRRKEISKNYKSEIEDMYVDK